MSVLRQRVTVRRFQQMKARGELIAMVTAYDANQGMLVDAAGIPAILVGDSLGNVVLGYDSTVPVTVEDMVRATAAVTRGCETGVCGCGYAVWELSVGRSDGDQECGSVDEGRWSAVGEVGGWSFG